MQYVSLFKKGAFLMAVSLLSLAACKRTSTTPALTSADDNGGYANDAAKLEQNSNDALSAADLAVTTNTSGLRVTTTYPTVTWSSSGSDTTVTIDFGPTDHMCNDGKYRKGQLIVNYSGHYKDAGSTHSITTNNYFVNDDQVIFHKTVTNEGSNSSSQVWYTVTVDDSVILSTGGTVSWTGNRTRTWLAGYSTADRSDDVYLIGGTTTLTRANGHVFTYTISTTDPLKIALACRYIESGTVTVTSSSFSNGPRTLDYGYGGGGCDDKAQLTIAGRTYILTLIH